VSTVLYSSSRRSDHHWGSMARLKICVIFRRSYTADRPSSPDDYFIVVGLGVSLVSPENFLSNSHSRMVLSHRG
jgi:hypothetical protein